MNARIKERIEQINSGIVPDGYQKSAFGIFPCDWEEVKLATIAEFCGGGTPSSKVSRYWQGNIPWISSADISEGEIFGVEVSRYITKEAVDNSSTKICPKGSIAVVTRVGVGKLAYMNKDYCTSQDFTNIIKSSVNKYMLAYAVQNAIQKHKERAQGTSIKGITAKEFGAIKISPPKSTQEQARIAEILMQWDKAIELQGKLVEAYQKLKKYCLNKMFPKKGSNVPEIRFPGFTAPWEQRKCKELCSITTGKSNTQDQFEDGLYPFYIRSDVPVRSNKFLYDCEAVITIGDGQIGKVFHYVNGKFDLHQRCYKMADFVGILGKYFFYYFSTKFYDRAIKMTAKATVDSVRMDMISEMDIQYPASSQEQNQIALFLERLDNLITLHQKKREKLVAQRKILQQYLLTGIVRV